MQPDWHAPMREALILGAESAAEDEVPVGAVVVKMDTGEIIGRGRDRKMALRDPTAHAEILALREAAAHMDDWRLEGCALVVTLEPCPMCAGAAIMARISTIIYGANNMKFGSTGTLMNLPACARWNHIVTVEGGVLANDCGAMLKDYFRLKRRRGYGE